MLRRAVAAALIVLIALGAFGSGLLRPLSHTLTTLRMYSEPRAPTGDVVVVDIDSKSIAAIGSWPWPRHLHADLIDKLVALGVSDIAFDVDFSAATNPVDDGALEAAIKRAAGKITLAAFVQKQTTSADAAMVFNRPLPRFADDAWVGSVNVRQDPDGMVRRFGYTLIYDGKVIPSIPAILAGGIGAAGREFAIDFSIDLARVDRISLIDVLQGRVDPQRLAGKKVIVGAQALELRDFFTVPVAGTISGAMLQVAATETLMQDRVLRPSNFWLVFAGLVIIASGAFVIGRVRWFAILFGLVIVGLLAEWVASILQRDFAFVLNTAPWHAALVTFAIVVLLSEIDFRELVQTMWRLRASNAEALLAKVVADNFAGVVVVDETGMIRTASRSASDLLSRPLIGTLARETLPPELMAAIDAVLAVPRADRRVWHPNVVQLSLGSGKPRAFEYVATVSEVESAPTEGARPQAQRVVSLTFTDVTEQRAAEERIAYLARFDSLTGLPNRHQLVERLDQVFSSARTDVRASAVVYFDLDNFKGVNDDVGHHTGDLLLRAVADRVAALLPAGALIARLGGDEFAAVISGPTAGDDAVALAKQAVSLIHGAFQLGPHRVMVTTSAGVALADARDKGPDDILKRADVALYRAKASGGDQIAVFERSMLQALVERQKLEADLWRAIEQKQFEVWYQPQIDLATTRITGVEALLRWNHPARGIVPPGEFIPVAEAIGLIDDLGRWALETATVEVATWPGDVRLSVNVSASQFARCDMAGLVASALENSGLPAHRLDLEITESLFMQPSKAVQAALSAIRALGVSLALDDFGTGYSSLNYIHRLPITKIKLDQSFVAGLPENAGSVAIVRAVAGLARDLDLQLNAEGVETTAQAAFLKSMGVDEVQGYLYGRPQPAHEVAAMVQPLPTPRRRRASVINSAA
ncbi:MAG TPA: EAL domain-containing protein [Bauldia sp.]|nr:EAL domain-containing protein [Bauldia sp.]